MKRAGVAATQGNNELARCIHNKAAKLQAGSGDSSALAAASSHFARGDDSTAFATALAAVAQRAPQSERDLFAARAVLQVPLLCFKMGAYTGCMHRNCGLLLHGGPA